MPSPRWRSPGEQFTGHDGDLAPGLVLGAAPEWVVLLEHRWAIPLRDAVRRAGGIALADAWIHPEDLVLYGVATNLV